MKIIFRKLISLTLLLIFSGCAVQPLLNIEERKKVKERTYPYSYAVTFNSTVATLETIGFPIEKIDKENGLILTGTRSVTFFNFKQRASVHIVEAGNNATIVRLNLFLDDRETVGREDYDSIFNSIDKNLQ